MSNIEGGFPPFVIKGKKPVEKDISQTRGFISSGNISIGNILNSRKQTDPFLDIGPSIDTDEPFSFERIVFDEKKYNKK